MLSASLGTPKLFPPLRIPNHESSNDLHLHNRSMGWLAQLNCVWWMPLPKDERISHLLSGFDGHLDCIAFVFALAACMESGVTTAYLVLGPKSLTIGAGSPRYYHITATISHTLPASTIPRIYNRPLRR